MTLEVIMSEDNTYITINLAQDNDLVHFNWPTSLTDLFIQGDYIKRFEIPEGVTTCGISAVGLRELILPDSLESLYVDDNFLTTLEIGPNMELLSAQNNKLVSIEFRSIPLRLHTLLLKNNRLNNIVGLKQITTLERIDLEQNPMEKI